MNPNVDAYIAKSAAFAQQILKHIRKVVHAGCPEVEEAIKWGSPFFLYDGMFCHMVAFKHHCAFGFWRPEMREALKSDAKNDEAAGQFGRLTSVNDLPSKAALTRLLKRAMTLNEAGERAPRKAAPKKRRPPLKIPPDFLAALGKNKKAHKAFTALSPSCQREYIEWITEAKREETRRRRVNTALQWIDEGKSRNWKYQ